MKLYNVIVFNQFQQGATTESTLTALQKTLKLTPAKAQKLLDSDRTIVKRDVEEPTAMKYKAAIEKCGLHCKVTQSGEIEELTVEASTETPSEPPAEQEQTTEVENTNDVYKTPESLASDRVFCRQCGTSMSIEARACPSCGAPSEVSGRSKTTAGFLAFFLGAFGLHRFYLGQWWGIFYIPFIIFGISGFVSFVEAIYFWCMSKESWNSKYGHLPPASGLLIVAIAILPIIAIIGILAAVAIPAYHEYTIRAKIAPGIQQLEATSVKVEEFILETNFIPNTKLDAGLTDLQPNNDALSDIDIVENGRIVGTFHPAYEGDEAYTLIFTPTVTDSSVSWSCTSGTLPNNYRPPKCRGDESGQSSTTTSSSKLKYVQSTQSNARIKVPSSWKMNLFENEDASIRTGNPYKESYVMLLEEHLSDMPGYTLEDYSDHFVSAYLEELQDSKLVGQFNTRNPSFNGTIYEIDANADGIKIRYLVGFYFAEEKAYQVLTWSLESRFEQNKHTMKKIINSLETF